MCLKSFISSVYLFAFSIILSAQPIKNISMGIHYGSVFAHSEEVQNTKGANPVGIEMVYSKRDTSANTYNICKCNTLQGINLVYFNYDNQVLGHALALNYVFEPRFSITHKTSLSVKGQFGLAYQSNPYHEVKNPTNMSYSLPVSFYAGLSLGSNYSFGKHTEISLYGNYLHTSNGGVKDPNKGVNWPTANIMFTYYLQSYEPNSYQKQQQLISKKMYANLFGFYSSRTVAIGQKERFSIFGLHASITKPLASVSGITLGSEIYNDLSLAQRLKNDNLQHISSIRWGLLAGHVFLLGKINLSQQLGYYLFNESPYFSSFYHRHILTYAAKNNLVFGLGLKAHRHVANFVDARIGYKIK